MAKRIEAKDLNIYYGSFHAVESVNLVCLLYTSDAADDAPRV